ncbi:MAG: 50S ribosomal protein L15 [Polyangiaceae bacterium]|nr:50S ribosomal protein L15 [Polyangiaceae bacterium]
MDILSKLKPPAGAVREHMRVGRGIGSGKGKTAGRGQKGQRARNSNRLSFEGGQMPMQRRIPKRGFRNPFEKNVANVNVGDLDVFSAGAEVTLEALRAERLVRGACDLLKVLGDGELSKALTVVAQAFSQSAREKIERAGGKAVVLATPTKAAG